MMSRVPATRPEDRPAPTCLDDLESWSLDDMLAWSVPAIRATIAAEQATAEMRVSVGLVLYRMRAMLGDGDFGHAAAGLSGQAGVTFRTLLRWRDLAEAHFQCTANASRPHRCRCPILRRLH